MFDMTHPLRRRAAIRQLLHEPEAVPAECLALLERCDLLCSILECDGQDCWVPMSPADLRMLF